MKNNHLRLLLSFFTLCCLVSFGCKDKDKTDTPSPTNNNSGPSLLSGAQTGQAYTGSISDFTLAFNNNSVVLLAAQNSTGKIYAIDLKDNDATKAAANTISAPVTTFSTNIAASLGIPVSSISYVNIEVNPISKAIYALVRNTQSNNQTLFKITNAGNTVEQLNVSNVSYSTINFSSTGQLINDMTWGDNTLYFSYSHASTLDGSIATAVAPFVHNSSATSRATTVYKSNWGGNYFTSAPLESMTYGEVDGEKRLMGVTVCAPGYSFKTSEITTGSGLLQVKEYFNLNTGIAQKVFCVTSNNTTYMIEVHEDGRIVRVGERYLNESENANQNGRWIMTYQNGGLAPAPGLTEQELKLIAPANTFVLASKYSETKLLVISRQGGQLSVLDI
ncbi:hypothetical protein QQ054_04060 [Oscillatoria amoena NRMC-F 0135]|nr:hypothetical protein [Oscillatoria amoena NRMC-F 0135]